MLQEENPVIRQTMLDLLTAKGFRRDIFSRGRSCLSQAQWEQRIGALRVRAAETPPLEHYRFSTSFGEASGDAAAYFGLERAIAAEPQPLAKLCVSTGLPLVEVVRMVSLLLDAGRVGLDRGEAGLKARAACVAANELLRLRMQQGWPYSTLAAPGIGNGLSFNIVEATLQIGRAHV